MENIWGSQRKTANMERGGLREENRRAHEEDERFRMTAVKAAGQVRQRMRCATGESDEVIRRKFMLPERYILTLMTVETLGQERMLLDLMAGGRLGADRNRLTAGDAARYIACPELDELADTLDAILSDSGLRRQVQGCCLRRVERCKTPDDNLRTRE